jgi:hypothetical protein
MKGIAGRSQHSICFLVAACLAMGVALWAKDTRTAGDDLARMQRAGSPPKDFVPAGVHQKTEDAALPPIIRELNRLDVLEKKRMRAERMVRMAAQVPVGAPSCGPDWQLTSPLPTVSGIYDSIFDGTRWVVVGAGCISFTSTDGLSWAPGASNTSRSLYGLATNGIVDVAVGGGGVEPPVPGGGGGGDFGPGPVPPPVPPKQAQPKRFFGSVRLSPVRLGKDAAQIAEEIVAHLQAQNGAEVTVTLDIRADIPQGADERLVRTVTENAKTLKFESMGFEEE